jgi:hypothetical protein
MKTWVRRSLNAGALTAGALLVTGTAAHADPTLVSSDNFGILNGTQVLLPVQAPIDVCGNAVAVVGVAGAGCVGGSAATLSPEWGWAHYQATTGPNIGIGNGTQVISPIQAPIDVCGNAVGVLGQAFAGCEGGASATIGGHGHGHGHGTHGHGHGHGHDCGCYSTESTEAGAVRPEGLIDGLPAVGGLLGGLTNGPTGLPVVGDLLGGLVSGGPAAGILGATPAGDLLSDSPIASILPATGEPEVLESTGGPIDGGQGGGRAGGQGGGRHTPPKPKPKPKPDCGCPGGHDGHGGHGGGHGHSGGPQLISTDNIGILNGTQVYAPIQIPINVSGNAISVLGGASAWSVGGSSAQM